jgi:hypothetical protein
MIFPKADDKRQPREKKVFAKTKKK